MAFLKPPRNIKKACRSSTINLTGLTDQQCYEFCSYYRNNTGLRLAGAYLTRIGCIQLESVLDTVTEIELVGCDIDVDAFMSRCTKLECLVIVSMTLDTNWYDHIAHSQSIKKLGLYNTRYDVQLFESMMFNSSVSTFFLKNSSYSKEDLWCLRDLKMCRRELSLFITDPDQIGDKARLDTRTHFWIEHDT